eukprot:CAMPEP_0172861776 /NCGR_PEP_ID=MMETSP1075-20121228/72855_1 /TAXON_ID=2916 /ORGANISM="Ceratium fusus, Strain PA161109" /LENGTH=189 /DNA_ID=CAMNT_0013709955 /DNA_START=224 /DNA_END=791 /DNA_ORIENTATION=-
MAQHLRMTPEHGASSTTGSVGKQALRSSEIAWASLHGSVNLAARNLMAVADLTDRGSASGAAESDATKKRMPRRAVRPPDTPRTGGAANVTGTKRGGVLRRPTLARLLSAHNIASGPTVSIARYVGARTNRSCVRSSSRSCWLPSTGHTSTSLPLACPSSLPAAGARKRRNWSKAGGGRAFCKHIKLSG